MRKRITGLLLGICLVVSMLPVTSFAAAYMAHSYEEWCDFIERYPGDQFGYGFEISASQGFTWPEEEVTITIEKNLYVNGTWVIPENVTVLNHAQVNGNLSIEGVWKNEVKQITETNYVTGSVRGNVTVKDGGQFVAQNNGSNFSDMTVENGGTLTIDTYGSTYVEPGKTLTLASGAIVNGNGGIQLGGTLCGEGVTLPQSTSITVNGRYSGTQADAVISGDVTVLSNVRVSSGTLTVPAGSKLTCSQIYVSPSHSGADTVGILRIDGELAVTSLMLLSGDDTADAGRAEVQLGSEGVLNMQPRSEISSLSPSASITGDGTLKLFAPSNEAGFPYNCPTIVVDYTWPYIDDGLDLALERGYLADTVTIWKSWVEGLQCDHDWVAGTVVEPTCTEEGYTLYTCSKCMATETRDIQPALGHTSDGNTDCSKDTLCTRCGTVLIPSGHQWTADTSQENKIIYTCTRCGQETVYELSLKDDMQIGFSSEALASLSEQAIAAGYETVLITSGEADTEDLTEAQQKTAASLSDDVKVFDVTLQAVTYSADGTIEKSEALHDFDGTATVRLPYDLPADMTGRQLKACYLAEDGSTEDKGAVSYSEGMAVFTTDHFSSYAVYTAKTSEQPGGGSGGSGGSGSGSGSSTEEGFSAGSAQGTPSQDHAGTKAVKTGDTNNLTLILLLLSASLAAGCAGMAVRKKK